MGEQAALALDFAESDRFRRGGVPFEPVAFQSRFLRKAFAPGIRTAALSLPRGNGKSTFAAWLGKRVLSPGDELHEPGSESHIIAASIGQARRSVFKQLKAMIGDDPAFRIAESVNNCHIDHLPTKTRLSILAANGKTAQGLVDVPFLIADEPGAWEGTGGTLVYDAIVTAQGKPGSTMRSLFVGTLAPATGGWWHSLIDGGSRGSVHVDARRGDPKRWQDWNEIRRVNPLMVKFAESRKVLREERDEARRDTRLKSRFLSYRLNCPSADEAEMLLAVADWEAVRARPVKPREGSPVVGIDLGQGRAWSAAVAIWPSGRTEAVAVAPGLPDLAEQERRDRVPQGLYQALADIGLLIVADGLRVPPVALLWAKVLHKFGCPLRVVCDRFRYGELLDAVGNDAPVEARVTRWSECASDIRDLRRLALDHGLTVDPASEPVIRASLMAALVKNDDAGNCRLEKRGSNNCARDDVASALLLAAGGHVRVMKAPATVPFYHIPIDEL